MAKIYTKTGDSGQTSLFGGKRVSKADLRVEAYGTIDELNSAIGVSIAEVQSSKCKVQSYNVKLKTELEKIQSDLFEIGSVVSNPTTTYSLQPTTLEQRIEEFEESIDKMTKELPELKNFILPGGGIVGSQLHFARTICRRAERRIVELSQQESVDKSILIYFNRLSDLLFIMARFVNKQDKKEEVVWKKK